METANQTPEKIVTYSSVRERILLEKQYHIVGNKINGPTTDLYFHEIKEETPLEKRILQLLFGLVLSFIYVITLPVFWIMLKLSGVKKSFYECVATGKQGKQFKIKVYNTGYRYVGNQPVYEPNTIQKFIHSLGAGKLPLSVHIIQENINIAGPQLMDEKLALRLTTEFSDFYKRFSVKPGYFSPSDYYSNNVDMYTRAWNFRKELKLIFNQSVKTDFKVMFNQF